MRRALFVMGVAAILAGGAAAEPIEVQYGSVLPEHQATLSKEPCALAATLKTKEKQVVVSTLGNWSATVLETDAVAVPYNQARACILLSGPDGAVRSITLGGFRTLRLTWVNDRLLYLFTGVGHIACVGQLLDVDDMKWLYARTEYYPQ